MSASKRQRLLIPDSTLITEQPAFAIILSGLVFSFFIGFAFKSYFSPARIEAKIREAASHIHRDAEIKFASSEISLSRWGLPKLEVVVRQIEIRSENECWMKPEILLDELRLPLSVRNLFSGKDPIKSIELGQLTINLRSERKECLATVASSAEVANKSPVQVEKKISTSSNRQGSELSLLAIRKIQINYLPQKRYYTEFDNLKLRVLSHNPLKLQLDSKTAFLKNEMLGDYLSNSKVHLEYNESPERSLLVHFFGNFREGYYSLIGRILLEDNSATLEGELKHIPLGAVLSLMQKYGSTPQSLNANNLWLSLKGQGAVNTQNLEQSSISFSEVSIEGDLLELKSENLNFSSIRPLTHDPIFIDIHKLNIQKLFEFYGRPHPSKTLGDLGVFKGSAEIKSEDDIQLSGLVQNLEFIFSNQGNREIQNINSLYTAMQFTNGLWKINLSRIEPDAGRVVGTAQLATDKFFKNIELNLDFDELLLNPRVQKLMTQNGEIGPMQVYAKWKAEQNRTTHVEGSFKVGKSQAAGISFDDVSAKLRYQNNAVEVLTQIESLNIANGEGMKVLSSIFPEQKSVNFGDVEGRLLIKSAQEFEWKQVVSRVERKPLLQTSGGWDAQGLLYGEVKRPLDKRNLKVWQIQGTRSKPEFVEK
ncbi:MAG: hypothetical protein ACLGGX_03825 [Bdellovibrionia bacterium]